MKKTLYLLLISFIFIVSCSSDDGADPTHEIGTWELDGYQFINFSSDFDDFEGLPLGLDELFWGGAPYDDYTLVLNSDGTFEREIGVNGPDLNDDGEWELDDDFLTLDSDDNGEFEWKVEKNEEDDLWISFEAQDRFIPNIYRDTVTQEFLDRIADFTDEQIDSLNNVVLQTATFDLVFLFERQ